MQQPAGVQKQQRLGGLKTVSAAAFGTAPHSAPPGIRPQLQLHPLPRPPRARPKPAGSDEDYDPAEEGGRGAAGYASDDSLLPGGRRRGARGAARRPSARRQPQQPVRWVGGRWPGLAVSCSPLPPHQ